MACYVTHLEAAIDGTRLPAGQLQTLHKDRPLWVRYDLDAVGRNFRTEMLRDRPATMWRYRELLPLADDQTIVSLGEGMTPLLPCSRLAPTLGLRRPVDQGRIAAADRQLQEPRAWRWPSPWRSSSASDALAIPTAGNAGGALAAYAARAGHGGLRLHARRHAA